MEPNDEQKLKFEALSNERLLLMKFQTQLQLLNIVVIGSIVSFIINQGKNEELLLIIPIISSAIFQYHAGFYFTIKNIEKIGKKLSNPINMNLRKLDAVAMQLLMVRILY